MPAGAPQLSRPNALAQVFAAEAANPARWDEFAAEIDALLARVPNPDPALLACAFGYGSFLPRQVTAMPELLDIGLAAELRTGSRATLARLREPVEADLSSAGLRRRRNRALAECALAQQAGWWDPETTWTALSEIAEALIHDATTLARQELVARFGELLDEHGNPVPFCVLGFGKLGSRELNFSSDVDLVFVAGRAAENTRGGPDGIIDAEKFLTRLAQRLITLLDEPNAHGFVYRVDMRLRPDGTRGVLVPSGDAFVDYHRSWSSSWERIALLRARPVGGDRAWGELLLQQLESHIFPRHLDFESLEAMRDIKARIDRESARRQRDGFDIKLGSGGIRELEFLVQNLQIIFGGREIALQVRGTLPALAALEQAGIVPSLIRERLEEAYRFLRHVENVLQSRDDRQTQLLPEGAERLELARACGFRGSAGLASFEERLAGHRALVAEEFANLYRSDADEHPPACSEIYELIEDEQLGTAGREAILARLGFRDPEAALAPLERLLTGPRASVYGARSREQFARILPILLQAAVESTTADRTLAMLDEFVGRVGGRAYIYALLRENPEVIRAVTTLFSGSVYLSRFFLRHPELLDTLVLRSYAIPVRTASQFSEMVAAACREHPGGSEERLDAMRRVRMQETLRIGWHDLNGLITLAEVQQQLTDLTVALVESTRLEAFAQIRERYGLADDDRDALIPIALGKLGSGEFGYGSDLDLIFVTHPARDLPIEVAIRWGQKLISLLQTKTRDGALFEVDMRLRPSGNQGLLVTTFDSFRRYHEDKAEIWERVALTKHRILLPEARIEDRLRSELTRILFREPPGTDEIRELQRIRERMERERGHDEPLKTGFGGATDIDFGLALVQLCLGPDDPRFREPNPWRLLAAMDGLPPPLNAAAEAFRRGLFTIRLLESRVRLMLDRAVSHLPDDERRGELARALGFSDVESLDGHLDRQRAEIRRGWLQILEGLAGKSV